MSFTVIIPARYGSTRLPGKPLIDLHGQSMIQRVVACAQRSDADRIIVATDDKRIEDAVRGFGGEVCMTRADHPSGTDRLHEVATQCGLSAEKIVVNVQGDEPLIPAEVINQVAINLAATPSASAATLSEAVKNTEDAFNPNVVKVVKNTKGIALYFSRASIPWNREQYPAHGSSVPINTMQRHIGIYAYRVSLLHQFVKWPVSTLEHIEKLEQLRILENGHTIHVAESCQEVPGGVDTPEDVERICDYFAQQYKAKQ